MEPPPSLIMAHASVTPRRRISAAPSANGVTYPADGFSYQISDGKGGTSWGGVLVYVYATGIPQVTLTNYPSSATAGTLVPLVAYVTPSQYITKVDFYLGQNLHRRSRPMASTVYSRIIGRRYMMTVIVVSPPEPPMPSAKMHSPRRISINSNTRRTSGPGAAAWTHAGSSGTIPLTNGVTYSRRSIQL